MSIVKITLEHDDGKIYYTDNRENIVKILTTLPKIQFKQTGSRANLIKKYKTILSIAAKERGYTKERFNLVVTPLIFGMFKDFSEYFINSNLNLEEKYSCNNLTLEGLQAAINNLEDLRNDLK